MQSYKETLNLPITKFPMKGNLSQKEPKILQKWNKNKIYKTIRKYSQKNNYFLIHDGPPYANGNIHIGHAINKILKDIIIKSKTLSGFNTPYTPFWDCHGLPIEQQIEKKKNINQINKNFFRNMCHNYVIKQIKKQKNDFIRLGVLGNWENAQLTMHPKLESNVINILKKIIQNKYLYQDFKPVHWCLNCKSALAEAEVEYKTEKTNSAIIMFKSVNPKEIYKKFKLSNQIKNIYIIIWTTTIWSIPANKAIAIHPKFKYQIIQFKKYHIILAKKLVKTIMKKIGIQEWNTISTIYGKKLEYMMFKHPFLNFNIPIILSEHVTLESGTGVVHIAPDHGEEDYQISQKYEIPLSNTINKYGKYKKNTHAELDEKYIFDSESIITNLIKKNNSLLYMYVFKHNYPYCWRHKIPIIYRATKQWFIKIRNTKLKIRILNAIKKIKWIPSWGYHRMKSMILSRPDWCISRQRTWGVPITIFIHKITGKIHPHTISIMRIISNLIKLKGSNIWWNINIQEIIGQDHKKYKKCKDILDVWFESGCINNIKLYNIKKQEKYINMCIEGSDQYRGWFMSSLIISQIIKKKNPFQHILTHGFVIDKSGQKMSKSIGNTITPIEIIKLYGADVLRLWVASINVTNDIIISYNTFQQISDNYRRIRNTIRFLLGNIFDFHPTRNAIQFSQMIILDKWMISKTKKLQMNIINLYQQYKFHKITKKIIKFCSVELGSFYLDIIKDRLYTTKKNSLARTSCQTTLYYILQSLIRWIVPILPFTADEIWNFMPDNNKSIFLKKWFNLSYEFPNNEIINHDCWKKLFYLKIEINKILEEKKIKKEIKHSLETQIIIYANNNIYHILKLLKYELKFMFIVSKTKIAKYELAKKNTYKSKKIKSLKIEIKKYLGTKCLRCWNYFNHSNIYNKYKNICNRCNENLNTKHGEVRKFI